MSLTKFTKKAIIKDIVLFKIVFKGSILLRVFFTPVLVVFLACCVWLVVFIFFDINYYIVIALVTISFLILLTNSFIVPFLLNCKNINKYAYTTHSNEVVEKLTIIQNKVKDLANFWGIVPPRVLISVGDSQTNSLVLDGLVSSSVVILSEGSISLEKEDIDLMLEYHLFNIAKGNSIMATFNSSLTSFLNSWTMLIVIFIASSYKRHLVKKYQPSKFVYFLSYITSVPFIFLLNFISDDSYQVDADAQGIVKGRYISNGTKLLKSISFSDNISRCEVVPLFAHLYYGNPIKRSVYNKRADMVYFERINNIIFCQALVRNYLSKKLGLLDLGIDVSKVKSKKVDTENIDFNDAKALQRRMRIDQFKHSLQNMENINPDHHVYEGNRALDANINSVNNNALPWEKQSKSTTYNFIKKLDTQAEKKEKLESYKMNTKDVNNVLREFEDKKNALQSK